MDGKVETTHFSMVKSWDPIQTTILTLMFRVPGSSFTLYRYTLVLLMEEILHHLGCK